MNIFQDYMNQSHTLSLGLKEALEAIGIKSKREEEVTIYAKIGNMDGLSQASGIEQHEQAEIKTDIGRIRIRKTTRNGRVPVYELTSKKPVAVGPTASNIEQTKTINEGVYNMFMDVCPTFMAKTRYTFKAEKLIIKRGDLDAVIKTNELTFDVDVFTKADGSVSEWCKIDLEIDKIEKIMKDNNISVKEIKIIAVISKLPFEPNTIVIDNKEKGNEDKDLLLKELYSSEFLVTRAK